MLISDKLNMRFDKGSMVEVLSKKKDLSGGWRCAQIVEDNGDGYTVRYYRGAGIAKDGVDKVSSEAVRPRPPPATGSRVWAVGDVVEVMDDGYWRVCIIEEVLENGDSYGIQVIGSVDEFRVRKSGVRTRQQWKNNQWLPLEKDSGIDKKLLSRVQKLAQMQTQGDFDIVDDQEYVLLSKTPKRSFVDESSPECAQKRRAAEKEVKLHAVPDSYSFNGKVQTPGKFRKTHGKDKEQISKRTTSNTSHRNHDDAHPLGSHRNHDDAHPLGSHRNHDDAHPLGRTSETDSVQCESSVASCSIGDANFDRLISHSSASCSQERDSFCSDAESFYHKGGDEAVSTGQSKQEDTLRSHELELNRYRSTLEALYACGPLSWELEFYLTNLRQKYSVSTDEHLMELRRLKSSTGLGLPCC